MKTSAISLAASRPSRMGPQTNLKQRAGAAKSIATDKPLIDAYDVYQHLMDYWSQTMQDDCYLIAADGWKAETYRVIETKKWHGRQAWQASRQRLGLRPAAQGPLVPAIFGEEQAAIDHLAAQIEAASAQLTELEEEHSGDDAVFAGFDKINKAEVADCIKEIGKGPDGADELAVLRQWVMLNANEAALDAQVNAHYPKLTEAEVKALVVDRKWLAALDAAIHGEMDRVSQALTQRVKQLAERYETPTPQMATRVTELEAKVNQHLQKMGFSWEH